jgi:hypothetical protein
MVSRGQSAPAVFEHTSGVISSRRRQCEWRSYLCCIHLTVRLRADCNDAKASGSGCKIPRKLSVRMFLSREVRIRAHLTRHVIRNPLPNVIPPEHFQIHEVITDGCERCKRYIACSSERQQIDPTIVAILDNLPLLGKWL